LKGAGRGQMSRDRGLCNGVVVGGTYGNVSVSIYAVEQSSIDNYGMN